MSDRHRALPSWMAKKEQKVKKEPLKSLSKQKAARAVFYCMNEKELVEAAVSYLTTGACEDVEDKAAGTVVKMKENPAASKAIPKPVTVVEESSDFGDDLDMTYVSETDLDITEVETLPYTTSPQTEGPKGQRSGPVQDGCGLVNVGLEAEEKRERSQMPTEAAEDDSLRLVREIFFT
ncbi:uncharacterized protein si:ch211-127m7.2 isoform X2 [Epinephelus fuscoguttatus]|uniref:uncharacterized protein si:ch211-127m7.2 isoform X2 n=1 Tax=Epinephelus fuscoguttatus TaxID=293821 RepID=UPI0020D1A916|nr:uncharacterized protein si:ch211-127m7.2 isoform X2 [Epinephelus fuscoguttatus]